MVLTVLKYPWVPQSGSSLNHSIQGLITYLQEIQTSTNPPFPWNSGNPQGVLGVPLHLACLVLAWEPCFLQSWTRCSVLQAVVPPAPIQPDHGQRPCHWEHARAVRGPYWRLVNHWRKLQQDNLNMDILLLDRDPYHGQPPMQLFVLLSVVLLFWNLARLFNL